MSKKMLPKEGLPADQMVRAIAPLLKCGMHPEEKSEEEIEVIQEITAKLEKCLTPGACVTVDQFNIFNDHLFLSAKSVSEIDDPTQKTLAVDRLVFELANFINQCRHECRNCLSEKCTQRSDERNCRLKKVIARLQEYKQSMQS
jgi:hypothetical protein